MRTLDVGCGNVPKGDVNLDIHYFGKWKNFLFGDAHHLPFKNGVFDKVYSSHTVEHLENPFKFFQEAKRVLKNDGILECIYPSDITLKKKTIHDLLNLRLDLAFKWKTKITGGDKINYGGHRRHLPNDGVLKLLKKAGFRDATFQEISFPTIRTIDDIRRGREPRKWKVFLNKYLPEWKMETKFIAE